MPASQMNCIFNACQSRSERNALFIAPLEKILTVQTKKRCFILIFHSATIRFILGRASKVDIRLYLVGLKIDDLIAMTLRFNVQTSFTKDLPKFFSNFGTEYGTDTTRDA